MGLLSWNDPSQEFRRAGDQPAQSRWTLYLRRVLILSLLGGSLLLGIVLLGFGKPLIHALEARKVQSISQEIRTLSAQYPEPHAIEKAYDLASEGYRKYSDHPEFLRAMILLHNQLDSPHTLFLLRQLELLEPLSAEDQKQKLLALYKHGREEEAQNALTTILQDHAQDSDLLLAIITEQQKQGRSAESTPLVQAYQKLIPQKARSPLARYHLAYHHWKHSPDSTQQHHAIATLLELSQKRNQLGLQSLRSMAAHTSWDARTASLLVKRLAVHPDTTTSDYILSANLQRQNELTTPATLTQELLAEARTAGTIKAAEIYRWLITHLHAYDLVVNEIGQLDLQDHTELFTALAASLGAIGQTTRLEDLLKKQGHLIQGHIREILYAYLAHCRQEGEASFRLHLENAARLASTSQRTSQILVIANYARQLGYIESAFALYQKAYPYQKHRLPAAEAAYDLARETKAANHALSSLRTLNANPLEQKENFLLKEIYLAFMLGMHLEHNHQLLQESISPQNPHHPFLLAFYHYRSQQPNQARKLLAQTDYQRITPEYYGVYQALCHRLGHQTPANHHPIFYREENEFIRASSP